MKKSILFSMMAAALLASCSNEEATQMAEGDLVPIRLSMTNADISVSPSTRGTGSIDGNTWSGTENIYVSAYSSTNPDFSTPMMATVGGQAPQPFFDLEAIVDGNAVTWSDGLNRYYPMTGSYNFYACHLGFTEEEMADVELVNDATSAYYPITIDGSQDLMAAKSDIAGSARNARAGQHPTLPFKHLLTRLKFELVGGNDQAAVTVTSIQIRSKATGRLVLATTTGDEPQFVLDDDAPFAELSLQDRDELTNEMIALEPQVTTTTATPIGESLLVPAADSYEIRILGTEVLNHTTSNIEIPYASFDLPAVAGGDTRVGKSYTVQIKLYGSQRVELTATLSDWDIVDEVIEYDPENE